jgi:cytochrome oxidase assembly protein ShyY1
MPASSGTIGNSRRRGLLVPVIMAAAGLILLVGLGLWQLERKEWKEGLIAALAARVSAAPSELPPAAEWGALSPAADEFRHVKLRVVFPAESRPAWLYTGASALRDDVKSTGYFAFTPARLAGGQQIVVNRGFAPEKGAPLLGGQAEITGYLRWPEKPGWFVAPHDSTGETWLVRDHAMMARTRGWGDVAPFYIDQEGPPAAGNQPRPGPLKVTLKNDHLNYALTWFSLSIVLSIIFSLWLWRRRREARGAD